MHCSTLQHTATHCNTRQHTATHGNTRQHTATHSNTRQYVKWELLCIAAHCNTLQHTTTRWVGAAMHCNTLQHTATHYNALSGSYTHSSPPFAKALLLSRKPLFLSALRLALFLRSKVLLLSRKPLFLSQGNVPAQNTLQHTATHCNTLQHTATHCTILQEHCLVRARWVPWAFPEHNAGGSDYVGTITHMEATKYTIQKSPTKETIFCKRDL